MSAADDFSLDGSLNRRSVLQQSVVAGGAASLASFANPLSAMAAKDKDWEVVNLPIVSETAPILFDIEFDSEDPKKGWIVGNRGTFLQTTDGGSSWEAKSFANLDPDEEINYRFTKVSFKDGEGWIIGKPAILLHTRDAGQSWERVPLSPKLPGDPYGIVALGPGKAEMSTSGGAIYTTENAGRNWKAQVKETIDATLNRVSSSGVQGASYFSGSINSIERDADGSYLAVSARGNFYLTYKPGDEFWVPHNRETSRRITAMGFVKDRLTDGLWMSTAGGEISKTAKNEAVDTNLINIPFEKLQIRSGGYGILDVAFLRDGKGVSSPPPSCSRASVRVRSLCVCDHASRGATIVLTMPSCGHRRGLWAAAARFSGQRTAAPRGTKTRPLTICRPTCTRSSSSATRATCSAPTVSCSSTSHRKRAMSETQSTHLYYVCEKTT
jgi:photosystem II stability/assembly factor-like uncharacterized protein